MMIFAYIEFKPFHIKGGSQALSNAIAEKILSTGGEIRYNTAVKKILVANGKVQGVVTDAGDSIHAPIVISNASKIVTYINLIDREHVPDSVLSELKGAAVGPSAFTMYMGFDKEPKDLGIHESTHFMFPQADIDNMYSQMRGLRPDKGGVMLTCYTVVDPSFSPPGTTQAALVTLQYSDQWFRIPPHQYASEKFRFADKMLSMAETVFPGLRGSIEEMEIATPITHLRYLGHPKGAVYGFDELTRQSPMFVPNRPPIGGLFLAGCWVGSGGFQPTLENGGAAGRAALRQIRKGESK
jgi:prolycopene isomerase